MLRPYISILLISAILIQSAGCTAVFFSAGYLSDRQHTGWYDTKIGKLKTDQQVQLLAAGQGILTPATYEGTTVKPWDECTEEYRALQIRSASEDPVPALLDSVTIILKDGATLSAVIQDFNDKTLAISRPADSVSSVIEWEKVSYLMDAEGRPFEQKDIRKFLEHHVTPIRTILHFHTSQGDMAVPLCNVQKVQTYQRPVRGGVGMAAVGACIDILIIYMLSNIEPFEWES